MRNDLETVGFPALCGHIPVFPMGVHMSKAGRQCASPRMEKPHHMPPGNSFPCSASLPYVFLELYDHKKIYLLSCFSEGTFSSVSQETV